MMRRICIYPKDVQRITGRSERYGRAKIKEIKKHYNKKPRHHVTVEEFCEYTGLSPEAISRFII